MYSDIRKRLFDIMLSLVGLLFLVVPMLCICVIVWIIDGRPIFFAQQRVGRYGRFFTIYKYRTMRSLTASQGSITIAGDSRITPIGRVLRKYKIDELPQLFCVVRGDMSFVGPRPDVPGYMDQLRGSERRLLSLRPGITGPATLKYRDEETLLAGVDNATKYNDEVVFPDKLRINLEYLDRSSILLDMRILMITIGVLKDRGNFWSSDR